MHMNGRVYDYNVGRFMGIDPFIHEIGGSQGINPYSYIMNNPLYGTDPSGYEPIHMTIRCGASDPDCDRDIPQADKDSSGSGQGDESNNSRRTGGDSSPVRDAPISNGSNNNPNGSSKFEFADFLSLHGTAKQDANKQNDTYHSNLHDNYQPQLLYSNRPENDSENMRNPDEGPSDWEKYIPVWGSLMQAKSDYNSGNFGWAAFNTLMAVSDVFLVKAIVTSGIRIAAGTAWKQGVHNWRQTRRWMGKTGQAAKGQHVHHWMAHQNQGPLKHLPDWIKNQPWNLMPMPSKAVHTAIHGGGRDKFNTIGKLYYGTPQWSKAISGYLGGRGINEMANDNY